MTNTTATLTRRETVDEFIARKRDPQWKAPRIPTARRIRRLTPEKLAALMAEHGATGSFE